ncbi:MAG: hypothetical protein KAR11_06350 [Phycisphaerae bacterium]|nr:hypothetical protein [Phycisphaerae bacterium]
MEKQLQYERQIVRQLAEQVAEFSKEAENEQIIQRWKDVNALRKPDRSPVWCLPGGCWEEIIPSNTLVCQDPWLRNIEYKFRKDLHKHDIGDDTVFAPFFSVLPVIDIDPPNQWGVEVGRHTASEAGGAWGYDPPLKTEADFDKLQMPTFTYNHAKTLRELERTEALLGGAMPVELFYGPGFDSATLGTAAADLRGLEQVMMDMVVAPKLVHKLMTHMRDAKMRSLDTMEASGLLKPNNTGYGDILPSLCSDPVGSEPIDGNYTLANCWCAGNSQEFDQVSPAMWEEFLLEYQKPIFERFGYVCYGCCENLTKKIDRVLSIPNLRIFVCSAWTNLDIVLDRIETDYCIMWRQKASDVVFPDDTSAIRRELEKGIKRLQGRRYQIVLRELQTLRGHSDRLHVWTDIAKELAVKYS